MNNPFRVTLSDPSVQREMVLAQDERLLEAARKVVAEVPRALFVGGFVRDALLGIRSTDADIEVYGMDADALKMVLQRLYPNAVNLVGRSFGIFKIGLGDGCDLDVALPRRESKAGSGHRGFAVEGDPTMAFEDAARRRDFTINALAADPVTGEVTDTVGGIEDLERRVLRVVDPTTFGDDPLRVYRALQFVARFDLLVDPPTFVLMRDMVLRGDLAELSKERVTDEIKKLLLKSERPSRGFELMRELGIVARDYPELQALIGTEQEAEWHPEGDVWIHTMMVIDQAAKIIHDDARGFDQGEKLQIMLGALCHDLGKPTTTQLLEGRIRSRGHEEAGGEITRQLCSHWTFSHDVVDAAIAVAREHLKPALLFRAKAGGEIDDAQYLNAVRRFVTRIHPISWRVLLAAAEADHRGRGISNTATEPYEAGDNFIRAVKTLELDRHAPAPLLQGRDLIALGIATGPQMGEWIRRIEHARDRGEITTKDQAIQYVKEITIITPPNLPLITV